MDFPTFFECTVGLSKGYSPSVFRIQVLSCIKTRLSNGTAALVTLSDVLSWSFGSATILWDTASGVLLRFGWRVSKFHAILFKREAGSYTTRAQNSKATNGHNIFTEYVLVASLRDGVLQIYPSKFLVCFMISASVTFCVSERPEIESRHPTSGGIIFFHGHITLPFVPTNPDLLLLRVLSQLWNNFEGFLETLDITTGLVQFHACFSSRTRACYGEFYLLESFKEGSLEHLHVIQMMVTEEFGPNQFCVLNQCPIQGLGEPQGFSLISVYLFIYSVRFQQGDDHFKQVVKVWSPWFSREDFAPRAVLELSMAAACFLMNEWGSQFAIQHEFLWI